MIVYSTASRCKVPHRAPRWQAHECQVNQATAHVIGYGNSLIPCQRKTFVDHVSLDEIKQNGAVHGVQAASRAADGVLVPLYHCPPSLSADIK